MSLHCKEDLTTGPAGSPPSSHKEAAEDNRKELSSSLPVGRCTCLGGTWGWFSPSRWVDKFRAALAEASSPHPKPRVSGEACWCLQACVYIQSLALFRNVLRIPDASAVGAKNSVNKHARHICHVSCLRGRVALTACDFLGPGILICGAGGGSALCPLIPAKNLDTTPHPPFPSPRRGPWS